MKRIGLVLAAVVLAMLMVAYWGREVTFDAAQIVNESAFKGRSFKGKTEEIVTLDGKVKAYLMQEHSVPIVAVSFGFDKSGTAYEPKEGAAILLADVMSNGAGHYSRQELRDVMKEKGIHFSVNVGRDRLEFSFSYVKAFEAEALEIIKTILYQPLISDTDLEISRQQYSAARKKQLENPQYLLQRLVKQQFYTGHPYARDNIPADEALAGITRDDVFDYLHAVRGKDNLKIGISGDIDAKNAAEMVKKLFEDLPDTAKVAALPLWQADFGAKPVADEAAFSAQSFVLMVSKGIARLNDDFYPLYLADYILGGSGLNSRLNKVIREERGLTYGIYSTLTHSDTADLWQIYFSATPDNAQKAKEITASVYADFYQNGVTETELMSAKKGLLASFNLRFASLLNIAEMLEQIQVQNLGIDFLEKRQSFIEDVSLEAVNAAIRKYMPKTLSYHDGVRLFEVIGK